MALGTVTPIKRGVFGDLRYVICDVQISSGANYATGGEPFAAAQLGLTGNLLAVQQVGGGGTAANKTLAHWDSAAKKLMAFGAVDATTVGLAEKAANTDLSAAANAVRLLCLLK